MVRVRPPLRRPGETRTMIRAGEIQNLIFDGDDVFRERVSPSVEPGEIPFGWGTPKTAEERESILLEYANAINDRRYRFIDRAARVAAELSKLSDRGPWRDDAIHAAVEAGTNAKFLEDGKHELREWRRSQRVALQVGAMNLRDGGGQRKAAGAEASEARAAASSVTPEQGPPVNADEAAIGILAKNPELSMRQIAERVGCNVSTLSRSPVFKRTWDAFQRVNRDETHERAKRNAVRQSGESAQGT